MQLNKKKFLLLLLTICSLCLYLFIDIKPGTFDYAMKLRLPKVAGVILAAVCLSAGTLIFQTLVNNRILTPCILGLTPLYVLTQTVIIFFWGSTSLLVVNKTANFLLTIVIMLMCSMFLYRILFERQSQNILLLLLIGTVLGSLFSSFNQTLQRIIDPNEFMVLQNKLFASLTNINAEILFLGAILLFSVIIWCYKDLKYLDVISMGKEQAISLGVNYKQKVKKFMLAVTILISLATAMIGPVTFLGFLVVNVTHEIIKTYKHKYLIIASVLIGCITILLGQTLVENVFHFNATLTSLITFTGGSYFIYMVMRENNA
ncbi:MAG: iron chelate uptake ABC transporter family permease subunit [Firmicutes bacterium]|nr:iron chelate uptake ABC transporter family permease subunit [Bacillota bacterium]